MKAELTEDELDSMEPFEVEEYNGKAAMKQEVTIDGITVKIGDLFPSPYQANEFMSKLALLRAARGEASEDMDDADGDD